MKLLIVFALFLACGAAYGQDSKIIGGDVSPAHAFPWQVYLEIHKRLGFFCGGSIISPEWVITAGHCTTGCNNTGWYINVFVGAIYSSGLVDSNTKKMHRAECNGNDVLTHPEYDPNNLKSDVGLIKIVELIKMVPGIVEAINLAPCSMADHNISKGDMISFSGWGVGTNDTLTYELRNGTEPVISQLQCQIRYPGIIGDSKFCINSTAEDAATCSGDSGGPATYLLSGCDSQYIELRGVTSFGSSLGCASGRPDGFTRVKAQCDWILKTTGLADTAIPPAGSGCRP